MPAAALGEGAARRAAEDQGERAAVPAAPLGHHVGDDAAVVIGGARLSGGYGKVFGAVVGTVIFAVIANLLSLLNVSTFLQDAFRGALILVAVTLATVSLSRRWRTKATAPVAK